MDKEKILTMEAGEELDSLIHEEVMGLCAHNWVTDKRFTEDYHYRCTKCKRKFDGAGHFLLPRKPRYSTGISAAWGVVAKMENNGYGHKHLRYSQHRGYGWIFMQPGCGIFEAMGESIPEAICKCALIAKLQL